MSRAKHGDTAAPATVLRCADCATVLDEDALQSTCAACGGLLVAEHRLPAQQGAALRALFDERVRVDAYRGSAMERSGVWRFRELVLPIALVLNHAVAQRLEVHVRPAAVLCLVLLLPPLYLYLMRLQRMDLLAILLFAFLASLALLKTAAPAQNP